MSTHGTDCDNGCGCHGNAIPPTSVIMARLDPDALARVLRAHRVGRATGGTSMGASCSCSCGRAFDSPGLREHAEMRAVQHQAAAVRAYLLGADL